MKALLFVFCFFLAMPFEAQRADSIQVGTASFYAGKFEGRKCSSGEIFRQNKLTAAHKTLKFGTWVRVINLRNDSSVIVRINDRLPRSSRRCIDLTKRAAQRLNFLSKGVTKVRIEILKDSLP
ncbi:MAG: septal ring lytic transglycosylase RlpA family protein [Bacteroidetes bacterium]|nr:septal ring lytic transglycosylase RlpA family protein [Bacteroidota bacterium]